MMGRNLLKLFTALAFVSVLSICAQAQTPTASLNGSVTDPHDAVVPGATVLVKNNSTGAEYKATTSSNGTFSIPALDSDTYTVTISATGFKQTIINNVKLDAGTPGSVRVSLEVGSLSETVIVHAGGEVLQTQSASINTTITGRQLTELPFTSRDALDFILLLPGTTTPGRPRTSTVNGLPKGALNITVDGINVQDNNLKSSDGFFTYVRPRSDAVDEITLLTATPGAESSGEGAVQIKFVTPSGTNKLKGSLFEYHRNPALSANYWFSNRDLPPDPATGKAPQARVLLNQYGFQVGGPVWIPKVFNGHDRVFFFVNYEGYQLPEQVAQVRTILHPQTQQGIFQYGTSFGVRQVNLLTLAASKGQTATIDPVIEKLLTDIRNSTSNTGGIAQQTDPNFQFFTFTNKGGQDRHLSAIVLTFNLTSKHNLSNVYHYQRYVNTLSNAGPAFPGFPNSGSETSYRFLESLTLRSTLTKTLVNEARVGLNGGTVLFAGEVNPGQFTGPIANQAGFNLGLSAAGISNATVAIDQQRRNTPVWQFQDILMWKRGAHSFSFGGSFSQINFWVLNQTMVPSITFGVSTDDPANAMFTTANFPGTSSADLNNARNIYAVLTGRVTAISANARLDEKTGRYVYLGPGIERGRQRELGVFAQDAWQMRPNLTLTGGLRWEVQFPLVALNDAYAQVSFNDLFGVSGPGNLFKPGTLSGRESQYTQYKSGTGAYHTDYKNFAPSLGIAWSPNWRDGLLGRLFGEAGRTVFRGGYSIAFVREGIFVFTSIFGSNSGGTITTNRNTVFGNLGTPPVLLRETNRLGPPEFPSAPTYPNTGSITGSANAFNPNLQLGYVQSWSFGLQRKIRENLGVEVRYVSTRGVKLWQQFNLNEINLIENGFLNEFKLAQANLQANIAAGRGNTFRYFGAGTGTSPLPIYLAYFSGVPASQAGDAAKYTSSNFGSSSFVNPLALYNPAPFTAVGTTSGLQSSLTFRQNALNAGLPANFFVVNPGKLGGAFTVENNGRTYYDAMVVELRRPQLSKGLLVQGNYTFAKALINFPVSSPGVFYQPRSLRHINGDKALSPFGITHALKVNWIYELPIGRGRALVRNAGRVLDRIIGGWEFNGLARVQSGSPNDFGNVRLVGMTRQDLQKAIKIRFDNDNRIAYYLPQDMIDNTIKAFNTSATSPTGYSLGQPTGRYIAPASGIDCIESFIGQCGTNHLVIYGPRFTRFNLSAVKKIRLAEHTNFEFRAEFLNAFNHINFFLGSAANDVNPIGNFSSAIFGQVTQAYFDTSTTNDLGGRMIQFVARLNF